MEVLDVKIRPRYRSSSPLPASSPEAQEKYFQLIGLLADPTAGDCEVDTLRDFFTNEEAKLLACAISHTNYTDSPFLKDSPDTRFTKDEYSRFCDQYAAVTKVMMKESETSQLHDLQEQMKLLVERGCQCDVHKFIEDLPSDEVEEDKIIQLMDTPMELNNYWGGVLMEVLFPMIAKSANLVMKVEQTSAGSPFAVQYEVTARKKDTPTSSSSIEFIDVRSRHIAALHAVVETQSKRHSPLSTSIAQAGIYSLRSMVKTNKTKLLNVVVTKKKKAQIFSIQNCNERGWCQRYLHSVDPIPLDTTQGLQTFAHILVSGLKWQIAE